MDSFQKINVSQRNKEIVSGVCVFFPHPLTVAPVRELRTRGSVETQPTRCQGPALN